MIIPDLNKIPAVLLYNKTFYLDCVDLQNERVNDDRNDLANVNYNCSGN